MGSECLRELVVFGSLVSLLYSYELGPFYPELEEVAQRVQLVLEVHSRLMKMLQLRILLMVVEVITHFSVAREPMYHYLPTHMLSVALNNHRLQTIPFYSFSFLAACLLPIETCHCSSFLRY